MQNKISLEFSFRIWNNKYEVNTVFDNESTKKRELTIEWFLQLFPFKISKILEWEKSIKSINHFLRIEWLEDIIKTLIQIICSTKEEVKRILEWNKNFIDWFEILSLQQIS
jgi:hypothetical protein